MNSICLDRCKTCARQLGLATVAFWAIAALGPLPAYAATYDYTGNDFTSFSDPTAYTSNDYITISFTTADALADKLDDVYFILTDFTFQDGVQTLSSIAGDTAAGLISTNATGQIIDWYLTAGDGSGVYLIRSAFLPGSVSNGYFDEALFGLSGNVNISASNMDDPGVWTRSTTPVLSENHIRTY